MTAPAFNVRSARSAELAAVTELCLAAFADEAVTAWVVPDPAHRPEHLRRTFGESLATVVADGGMTLALTPEGEPVAASVWLSCASGERATGPEGPAVQDEDPVARRLAVVDAATGSRHPTVAHLHLSAMAVLPHQRGRGAGAAVLAAGLERARARRLPVYLEASTPDNRRLYERHGFRHLGDPISLPEGGPSLQPMWCDTSPDASRAHDVHNVPRPP
ncbi:GNAT family N-acetyltransferase [Streptomyces oceani]|uniref:N-acetyltransferase domain-containing protein n=1 Tax=Streptomyces oceani TaxID=1075402 RepID=A0A1E7KKR6_9ACTN|nr:GNAT family N-acetyltransferase [Streptomyces oceani]OEV04486.1 hypothetical protein AN216_06075 [Streptomyces oceani]